MSETQDRYRHAPWFTRKEHVERSDPVEEAEQLARIRAYNAEQKRQRQANR